VGEGWGWNSFRGLEACHLKITTFIIILRRYE
jgi:hypothetical protein